jgi:serine/threonine protein kinase
MEMIANKYKCIGKLGEGGYGSIYKYINIRTKEEVAVKVECKNDTKLLKNETIIYQYLNSFSQKEGIPKVYWYGSDQVNYYMVMELLGKGLNEVDIEYENIMDVGRKILNRVEFLHSKKLIHRDIKPANFLFGRERNKDMLYMIDFGFCRKYMVDGFHIKNKKREKRENIIGTPNFVSINVMQGNEPSRRDDLESVVYIMYYLWKKSICVEDKERILNGEDIPSFISLFFKYCRSLSFEEDPDYKYLYSILSRT